MHVLFFFSYLLIKNGKFIYDDMAASTWPNVIAWLINW